MGDTSSAALFGDIFDVLAKLPATEERDWLARYLWKRTEEFDFSDRELEADASLVELGVAYWGVDPEEPEAGPVVLYREKRKPEEFGNGLKP